MNNTSLLLITITCIMCIMVTMSKVRALQSGRSSPEWNQDSNRFSEHPDDNAENIGWEPTVNPRLSYTVCMKTVNYETHDIKDVGTTDNIRVLAKDAQKTWSEYHDLSGGVSEDVVRCFNQMESYLSKVDNVIVGTDGDDDWIPMYITISSIDKTFYCRADLRGLCRRTECAVNSTHYRTIPCKEKPSVYDKIFGQRR